MASLARLSVVTGPDRGRVCEVTDEVTHVGSGGDSHLVLNDPDVAEHLLSVVERNGRYAIFSPIAEAVFVEGMALPAEKWVWLPGTAEIKVSRRTQLRFETVNGSPASGHPGTASSTSTHTGQDADQAEPLRRAKARATKTNGRESVLTEPALRESGTHAADGSDADGPIVGGESLASIPKPKRGAKGESRKVAKFITDGPGEPLVRLGEDGHLPELALREGAARQAKDAEASSSNPLVMYGVLAFSVLASLGLLLLDTNFIDNTSRDRAEARREIERFYGDEGKSPRPYQMHLRQARQATSRGDGTRARIEYRKVLDMLRAEGNDRTLTGVTGSRDEDRELERLIGVLLSR